MLVTPGIFLDISMSRGGCFPGELEASRCRCTTLACSDLEGLPGSWWSGWGCRWPMTTWSSSRAGVGRTRCWPPRCDLRVFFSVVDKPSDQVDRPTCSGSSQRSALGGSGDHLLGDAPANPVHRGLHGTRTRCLGASRCSFGRPSSRASVPDGSRTRQDNCHRRHAFPLFAAPVIPDLGHGRVCPMNGVADLA